ncbi:MAG: pyridoxamine 5'-phosphate oxidase family protein [Patescibacteria group bacterium]
MDRRAILEFMGAYRLGVLSTINEHGEPEAAVVGISVHEGFMVVVATGHDTRKCRNIQRNGHIALVVGWDDEKTVQYEGRAHILEGEELRTWQSRHFAKRPESARYKDDPQERYILIEPTWLRYTDCNVRPWFVQEIPFESK